MCYVFFYIIAGFLGILGLIILIYILIGKIDISLLISEAKPGCEASMSRFQLLIFTFVISSCLLIVICHPDTKLTDLKLDTSILSLLGISGGSYVISKGIQSARDTKMKELDSAQNKGQQQQGQQGQT
jgi:hypothetical protein